MKTKFSSPLYHLLKPLITFFLQAFFHRIEISGLEHLQKNQPILLTPNHQSAFMDAIVVACAVEQPIHSVTRALVFEKPIIAKILRNLNMMPIYRIRNGIQNLSKNETIFDYCVELLQHGENVLIFPEGSQNVVRKVRPLSKGFSRIVFRAEASQDFEMGLQIVPVGINYSQTTLFRGDLYLRFGEALEVKEMKELYGEQPQQAMNQLRKDLQVHLEKEVVHIGEKTFYETFRYIAIDFLPSIVTDENTAPTSSLSSNNPFSKNTNGQLNHIFQAQKTTIQQLNELANQDLEAMQLLEGKVKRYRKLLKQLKLDASVFGGEKDISITEKLKVVLLAPIGGYGFVNHYLACKIPQVLTYKMFKDPSFFASMKLGFGLLSFLFFYALQTILVGVFSGSFGVMVLYLLSLVVSGWVVLHLAEPLKKWGLEGRKRRVQKKQAEKWRELEVLHGEILKLIDLA